ncbi:MAG: YdcF family protein [Alphaproteobacteria bacterium]|nr:YdcF family protein [Alphaproteobacteria bacterium]
MRKLFYFCLILLVAFLFGLAGFVDTINKYEQPKLISADVAVVLTGGSGRIEKGIEILNDKKVEKLFISGVHKSVAIKKLLNFVKNNSFNKYDDSNIILGYQAKTTFDNAIEVANFIKKNNYKSIYLITSKFHMPRSMYEVRHRLPNIKIIPYPVNNNNIKIKSWYSYPGTLFVLTFEYLKTLLVILRISILSLLSY